MEKITKLLTFFVGILFAMTTSASVAETNATNYDLKIHGVTVTSENASDVLGNGVFSYDATANILNINGSFTGEDRKRIVESSIPGLTVEIKSYAVLEASNAPVFAFMASAGVTGSGLLIVNSPNECGFYVTRGASLTIYDADIVIQALWGIAGPRGPQGEKLTINNSNVSIATSGYDAAAIADFNGGFDLVKSFISSPEGAYFDTKDLKEANGSIATNVVILTTIVETTIDGIRYFLDRTTHEASVIWNYYDGDVDIPVSVTYGDETYAVTAIYPWSFSGRNSVVSITLPEGLTTIGDGAFNPCASLTTVALPSTLTSVGTYVLLNDPALESVYCYASTPPVVATTADGGGCYLVNEDNTATLYVPSGSLSAYQNAPGWSDFSNIVEMGETVVILIDGINYELIPSTHEAMVMYKEGYTGDITIPATVTYMGMTYAVTSVRNYAFGGSDVTSITLPEGLTSISDLAFFGCANLTSITLPSSVTQIGNGAFAGSPLTDVYCYAVTPPTLTSAWIFENQDDATLHVPAGSVSAYQNADGWRYFGTIVEMGMIINGDFEGTDMSAFSSVQMGGGSYMSTSYTLEQVYDWYGDGHFLGAWFNPVDVESNGEPIAWQNRLYVKLNGSLSAGDHFRFSVRVRTMNTGDQLTISGHGTYRRPGVSAELENYWGLLGEYNVTSEWQTFEVEGVVPESTTNYGINELMFFIPATGSGMMILFDDFCLQKESAEPDTDYSLIDNTVYLEPVQGVAGGQTTLSVKMKNTEPIQGFAFTLALPEGVTVATDADGFPMAALSEERTTSHKTDYFGSNIDADGNLRVVCSSSNGYTFDGNDGEVARITVNLASTMTKGDYAILLKNVSLSNNLNESHSVEKLKSTLSVIDFIPGDVNGDLEVDVADFTLMANYLLGKTLTVFIMEAADVAGGIGGVPDGDIDVADLTGIANIILHQ